MNGDVGIELEERTDNDLPSETEPMTGDGQRNGNVVEAQHSMKQRFTAPQRFLKTHKKKFLLGIGVLTLLCIGGLILVFSLCWSGTIQCLNSNITESTVGKKGVPVNAPPIHMVTAILPRVPVTQTHKVSMATRPKSSINESFNPDEEPQKPIDNLSGWDLAHSQWQQLSKLAETPEQILPCLLLSFTMPVQADCKERNETSKRFTSLKDLRGKEPSLDHGDYFSLYSSSSSLAFLRIWGKDERFITAVNLGTTNETLTLKLAPTEGNAEVKLPKSAKVMMSTDENIAEGSIIDLDKITLKPGAVVLLHYNNSKPDVAHLAN